MSLIPAVMPNSSSVLTVWNGVFDAPGLPRVWPARDREDYPTSGFVRYYELMACTGGNAPRISSSREAVIDGRVSGGPFWPSRSIITDRASRWV